MQIAPVSIRAKLRELKALQSVLTADAGLIKRLENLLGKAPDLNQVNELLEKLAEQKRDITRNDASKILKPTNPRSGWWDGKNGVLEYIIKWADEELKPKPTEQPNPADEAASAQAASIPTLLAATGEDTVETLPPEPKIDGNIDHARKMLARAGLEVHKEDTRSWEAWCNERGNWEITGHTFHSTLQSDFFSTGAHVKNILTIKHKTNGFEVTMGPDDARGLFTDKRDEIDSTVNEKFKTRRQYQRKASEIIRLINLFDEAERESIRTLLTPMTEDIENIGDGNFNTIDRHYERMVQHWNSTCSTNYTPHDFLKAIDNIQSICQDLVARDCDLGRFQDPINRINENRIIPSFSGGTIPTNEEHIGLLVTIYRELLQYQKDLPETFGLSHKRRVREPLDRVYATHRGEGGLFALRFLIDRCDGNNSRILDFCGNGVLWTVAGHISEAGLSISRDNIIDLERINDSALFESNPNPNRFLANLSNIITPIRENGTALASEKYKAVVLNFVLNHFTDDLDAMKEAVIAAREFLQNAPADTANVILNDSNVRDLPLFVVLLPESCQLERSPLNDILRSSGLVSYMQLEGENEVQGGRYQAIRDERGIDVASGVNSRVKKPYKIHIYALVDNKDLKYLRLADKEAFELLKINGNGTRGQGADGEDKGELKSARIQKNIAASNLRALDLVLPSNVSIPSSVIVNDPKYADFEQNLATLIEFRQFLHPKEQARLDEILQLWVWKFVPALSEINVNFVMNKPRQIKVPHGEIPNHLQAQLTKDRNYSLVDLCRAEDAFRQSSGTIRSTVLTQNMPSILFRLRTIHDQLWERHRSNIEATYASNVTTDFYPLSERIRKTLNTFCLRGLVMVSNEFDLKTNSPFYNQFYSSGTFTFPRPNCTPTTGITTFIATPQTLFRPCDISTNIRRNATINERIEAHQANIGLTDVGFQWFIGKQGIRVATNFVQQLKSVPRKTISKETAQLIAKALSTSPEDILPS